MKRVFFTILVMCTCIQLFSQSSFELTYVSENDQYPVSIIEDELHDLYISYFDNLEHNGNIIKIDNQGNIIDEIKLYSQDGVAVICSLIPEMSSFFALGTFNEDTNHFLWFNKFNLELNQLIDVKIPTNYRINEFYYNALINLSGNIIVAASYYKSETNKEICLFEISPTGALINEKYLDSQTNGSAFCYDFIQDKPNGYKLFTTSYYLKIPGQIVRINEDFEVEGLTGIPWTTSELNSAKYIDDNNYLLTGKKLYTFDKDYDWDIGMLKLDLDDNLIDSLSFGKQDTVDTPGIFNNLDFINPSNIYFGGFSNVNMANPYFSTFPTWIMLNKLDENLELQWQKFYGGDACYNLWSMVATIDGGCVLAGARYDHLTQQEEERDVYILKVNEDGLITWAHNIPTYAKEKIVYPNPAKNNITISSYESSSKFDLFDIHGQRVYEKGLSGIKETLNISHIQKGIYIYKIMDSNGSVTSTGKWIKE